MQLSILTPRDFRRKSALRNVLALVPALALMSSCDSLFEVENPSSLLDQDLLATQLENSLSNSAEGNLTGPLSTAMRYGELTGDQYWHPSLQDFGLNIDRGYRDRSNSAMEGAYTDLAAGLWIADEMVRRLQDMVANPAAHLGVANSYFWGGVARMALASYFREVTIDGQAPITPAAAMTDAISRFESAAKVAAAVGNANLEAGSYGAIARAYRGRYYEPIGGTKDPADFAKAEEWARKALDKSSNFRVVARFGSPGPGNSMGARGRERVTPWYAFVRDPVSGVLDPRLAHVTPPETSPAGEFLLRDLKYPNTNAPLPISRAAEAELIIAEARYLAGDMVGAVQFINRVRARSNLAAFASTDPAAIWTQLMYERDTEMFLEGRSWEDHRYYNIIPRDWDAVNKQEGMVKNWPVSSQESANNPNFPK